MSDETFSVLVCGVLVGVTVVVAGMFYINWMWM
jgi:hypothetical protein